MARRGPVSVQPSPVPSKSSSIEREEMYPVIAVKLETYREEIFVLRATRVFVKRVLVVLIVDATNELVNIAFVLKKRGKEDIYPNVPRPKVVDVRFVEVTSPEPPPLPPDALIVTIP